MDPRVGAALLCLTLIREVVDPSFVKLDAIRSSFQLALEAALRARDGFLDWFHMFVERPHGFRNIGRGLFHD